MSCEQRLPGEEDFTDVLREFGYHWLDQLLLLTESAPQRVFAQRFYDETRKIEFGFLAIIDFANGCTARMEVDTRSRLGYRTGWMLEGSSGSYRHDKIYTVTLDGEIVDEFVQRSTIPKDPFVTELVLLWRGETTMLPTLNDVARVVRLIEAIEESDQNGKVVEL